jgi:hypothetical protein
LANQDNSNPGSNANRHERRRHAAISELRQLRLSEIKGTMCGWRGCEATLLDGEYPPGWSSIINFARTPKKTVVNIGMGKDRPVLDLGRLDWLHDKALCPEHTRALAELLWAGLDPRMSDPAGQA